MGKAKLTWWGNMMVRLLKKEDMPVANVIIETAYPGYRLSKYRKDRGIKKGGKEDGRTEDIRT